MLLQPDLRGALCHSQTRSQDAPFRNTAAHDGDIRASVKEDRRRLWRSAAGGAEGAVGG